MSNDEVHPSLEEYTINMGNMQQAPQGMIEDIMSGFIHRDDTTSGVYAPQLVSNQPGTTMGDAIRSELRGSTAFDISVAFVSENMLKSLYQTFLDQAQQQQGSCRIITSTKNYFNTPQAFKELMKLQRNTGVEVHIWEGQSQNESNIVDQPFHPKGYMFTRVQLNGMPYYNLYVGSSNLTAAALQTQREWNLRISATDESQLIEQVRDEIETQLNESIVLTDDWIEQYEEDFRRYAAPRKELIQQREQQPIHPNTMQQEALHNLAKLREAGEHRAIVISATGTGKTYLSAFDVQACHPRRMLYVANRAQILTTAMQSYKRVLGDNEDDYGLFTGSEKQANRKYVFATVNMLCSALNQFDPNDFDYILIDEVHHAGAKSYSTIIDHFKGVDFMLGMTATPERTDGINIFELFHYNVAYEIRLQQALDANMLCPFHYYGVAEYLGDDDTAITVSKETSAEEKQQLQYELQQLATPERVRYIIRKIEQYGSYESPVTGLVFCSRVDEAQALSDLFNQEINQQAERLYRTCVVTGSTPERKRSEAIEQLENGEIDYIFTVDLFNEGIDIPALNQIIMLRNTQSSIVFTQQLGRGLRKFPNKTCVTVLDFIGNYTNNYLIPVALYGNVGSRDTARKNLERESIGLSSISFDEISRERVLKSLDSARWSDMRRFREQYVQVRYELGRIPMLHDMQMHDPSLVLPMATHKGNYLALVRGFEQQMGKGAYRNEESFAQRLQPVSRKEDLWLKMVTENVLTGLRAEELVILNTIFGCTTDHRVRSTTIDELDAIIAQQYPREYHTHAQLESALRVLNGSYFDAKTFEQFGRPSLITVKDDGSVHATQEFQAILEHNSTFALFFDDCVRTGFAQYRDLIAESVREGNDMKTEHGFVIEHRYKLFEVERLLNWEKQVNGSSVGGYLWQRTTGTMPIFIKYANSQYADRFLNPQEMLWYSKNGHTLRSPEFPWLLEKDNAGSWDDTHFVPLFIMRKEEAKEPYYYYVGHVKKITDAQVIPAGVDGRTQCVTTSHLQLARPLSAELYRHLTGKSTL